MANEEFTQEDFDKAVDAWDAYKRNQLLKCMFLRYKRNKDFCETGGFLYFLLWLKGLICLLFNWQRYFDYKDSTATVCTTDEEWCMDSADWIACDVHRHPFVWGVHIYEDGN